MQQGKLDKARRCKLFYRVPVGYVRLSSEEIVLDPDPQVQAVVRLIFSKFVELGSCRKLLQYLQTNEIDIPERLRSDSDVGQLHWHSAKPDNLYAMLHHPIYAGAYVHGRIRRDPNLKIIGKPRGGRILLPWEQWKVLRKDALPAYITWEQYLDNQHRLSANQAAADPAEFPPEDASLVEGLVICGHCNRRMRVETSVQPSPPYFLCRHDAKTDGTGRYSSVEVRLVDELVSRQVLESLQPIGLRLSLKEREEQSRRHKRLPKLLLAGERHTIAPTKRLDRWLNAEERDGQAIVHEMIQSGKSTLQEEKLLWEESSSSRERQAQRGYSSVWESMLALATEIPALWITPSTSFADQRFIIRQLLKKVVIDMLRNTEDVAVLLHWASGPVSRHKIVRSHQLPTVLPIRAMQCSADV
jgi:hypothetical protein